MNILIVSYEAWRDTNNGGNVLSNIFSAFSDVNIAQVYCSGEMPSNSVCQKYFQISDTMLLSKSKGSKLEEKIYKNTDQSQSNITENIIKSRTPDFFREFFMLSRELLWSVVDWKTEGLKNFIIDFQPDIIFAPCYSFAHMAKVALFIQEMTKCPVISYISDDNYSCKRLSFSVSFWINRFITRKWIRKLFEKCSLVYTMTNEQKKEYEKIFNVPMKILCKAANFDTEEKRIVNSPIKLIYGGGLYLNRWKVLEMLARELAVINKNQVLAELHIYSGSKLRHRQKKYLNDERSSFLHDSVPFCELEKKYKSSDIAIHVESFDLRNKLITRLSFSTKIIDCMNSGCAILAIGPRKQAGIAYLKEWDAAICIHRLEDIKSTLMSVLENPTIILFYSNQAKKLGMINHQSKHITDMIKKDFYDMLERG